MASILFKWLIVGGFLLSAPQKGKHPFFVSVTEIEQNAKEKTLEISCKIFTDDFEKTLRQTYKGTVDLLEPKDKAAMNKLVSDYVKKHLSLVVDGKPVLLEFIGYEQQEEGIESYYQVNNISAVKKIDVTDNILYEYKKEQVSLLHVIVNGNRKSYRLNNPDAKVSFEFWVFCIFWSAVFFIPAHLSILAPDLKLLELTPAESLWTSIGISAAFAFIMLGYLKDALYI